MDGQALSDDNSPIDLTKVEEALDEAMEDDAISSIMSIASSALSSQADAPEDRQEMFELVKIVGGNKSVLKLLRNHIMVDNPFVKRWTRRGVPKRSSGIGMPPGRYGDVEYACFEAWYEAKRNNDEAGMFDAVRQAMNDAISRGAA